LSLGSRFIIPGYKYDAPFPYHTRLCLANGGFCAQLHVTASLQAEYFFSIAIDVVAKAPAWCAGHASHNVDIILPV
jgi:hypothetical protein